MSIDVGQGEFACGACGKRWPWMTERAGKKARCTCGHVMRVPATPEEFLEEGGEDLYGLAQDEFQPVAPPTAERLCPACGVGLDAAAVLCVACGYDLRAGRKIGPTADAPVASPAPGGNGTDALREKLGVAPTRAKLGVDEDKFAKPEPAWRKTFLPLAMIVLGIAFTFVRHMWLPDGKGFAVGAHCVVPGLTDILTNLATTVAACFGIAWLAGFDFPNEIPVTILKLCGVALLPSALAGIAGAPLDELNGALVTTLGGAALTFGAFLAVFRLPMADAAMCVLGIVILHGARQWVLYRIESSRSDGWL
ncbi:MAG: hypothetical protein AAF743_00610 [Planctomycetota bacterium]